MALSCSKKRYNTIILSRHKQFCLMRLRFERCFSRRSLIKRTCSLRDKLIVLLTVNRQAKIFLRRKKLPALLRRIASKDNADSYYLNCLHFFTT